MLLIPIVDFLILLDKEDVFHSPGSHRKPCDLVCTVTDEMKDWTAGPEHIFFHGFQRRVVFLSSFLVFLTQQHAW